MPACSILLAPVQGSQGTHDRQMGGAGHRKGKGEEDRTVPVRHLV